MADVVVVTEGSAGIGRAVAREFAQRGCAVGPIARGETRLADAKRELEAMGVRVHTVSADVADAGAVERAAAATEQALGPVTIWVNNAMATVYAPVRMLDAEEVKRVTEATYLGAVNGTLAALRRMTRRGTIVQVSSVLSWRAIPIQGAYCGAKFALRGFTESLRSELIHDGSPVHLTMVHLPGINTPQFEWARNKTGRAARAPDPIHRPEVAARAVVYAAYNRRRDIWVSRSTLTAILAGRLAPSLLDRYLAKKGYEGQLSDEALAPMDGNLHEPVAGDHGARGRFDGTAQASSREVYTSRQAGPVAAGLLLVGAAGIKALIAKRSNLGRRRGRRLPWVALLHPASGPAPMVLPRFAWAVTDLQWHLVAVEPVPIAGGMNDNFPMPGCRVERVAREAPDLLRVAARGARPSRSDPPERCQRS